MLTRRKVGFTAGALALLILAGLIVHAVRYQPEVVSPGYLIVALVDAMLWMLGVRLASEATSYVSGVQDTVDRLASALKDRPR